MMLKFIRRFKGNESGATAIEYALIGGLISVSVIVGASQMGTSLGEIFQGHADVITEANENAGFE